MRTTEGIEVSPSVTKIPSVHHMSRTELNMLLRQMHAIPRWDIEQKTLYVHVKNRLNELNRDGRRLIHQTEGKI